ncbi:MAG: hypothetical protein LBP24_00590 [Coriobacteriales bacterium]|jgi:hypothetical protein|nr:hypothetical protein [Coriobacteriales bacterium]
MKTKRYRTLAIVLVLCNLLVYAGAIGAATWNDWQIAEAKSIKWGALDLWDEEGPYTESFRLMAVARPEVAGVWSIRRIALRNLDIYTRAEYVTEFPPFEEREWGTVYFVPSPAGETQKVLDRLNEELASIEVAEVKPGKTKPVLSDYNLTYPITIDNVLQQPADVRALLTKLMEYDLKSYERVF